MRILPYISGGIILVGLMIYMNWNFIDYQNGVNELNNQNSASYQASLTTQAQALSSTGKEGKAIELMIKSLEINPQNIEHRLQLATIYCKECKSKYVHCEDAVWHLNVLIKTDSTFLEPKQLLLDLETFLSAKK